MGYRVLAAIALALCAISYVRSAEPARVKQAAHVLLDAEGTPNGRAGRLKANGESTLGAYSMVVRGPYATPGPEAHTHERVIEAWYVIEGELEFQSHDAVVAAPAGTFVLVPPGVNHRFSGEEGKLVKVAQWISPPGFEVYLDERMRLPGYDPAKSFAEQSPEWKAAGAALAREYGGGPSEHPTDASPIVAKPDDRWQGRPWRQLASWKDSGDAYQVFEWKEVPRESGLRTRSKTDDAWYVLAGELTFDVDGKRLIAPPGATVWVPRNTSRRLWTSRAGPVRFLAIHSAGAARKR